MRPEVACATQGCYSAEDDPEDRVGVVYEAERGEEESDAKHGECRHDDRGASLDRIREVPSRTSTKSFHYFLLMDPSELNHLRFWSESLAHFCFLSIPLEI